jgi:hypothetical protein
MVKVMRMVIAVALKRNLHGCRTTVLVIKEVLPKRLVQCIRWFAEHAELLKQILIVFNSKWDVLQSCPLSA